MSDISKIQIGSALYDINDATARNAIEAVTLNAVNRNGIYRGKDLGTITASNIELIKETYRKCLRGESQFLPYEIDHTDKGEED